MPVDPSQQPTAANISPSTSTNPYEGVSNPPDGGAITSIAPDQTQSQSPIQPPSQPPSTQTVPAPASGPVGNGNNAQPGTVSNAPVSNPTHPGVQRAGIIREIAQTLAGGPRWQYTANEDGTVSRQPVSLSKGEILGAIALEALSGSLAGLGARPGPGATGRAGAVGFQQGLALQQQQRLQAEQQAQQDAAAKSKALVQAATLHELASRTILNTQQAERLSIQNLKDSVDESASLLQGYKDAGAVSDEHVPQDTLMAGMKSGQYSALKQAAIPDGWTNVDGRWEQTFAIVQNPSAKVPLTQADVDRFSAAHVRGFPPGMKIPNNYEVPGYILANANQQLLANKFMLQEAGDVANVLAKSDDPAVKKFAANIPDFGKLMDDQQNGLALQFALPRLQKYLHHDGTGDDFWQAVSNMAQLTRPNPANPKQPIDNSSDAKAAQVIAGAFGNGDAALGWKVLRAYHDEVTPAPIKSEGEAESILSDNASTPREKAHAKAYLALTQQQKANEALSQARAKKIVEGTGTATTQDVQQASDAIATGKGTFEQLTSGMGKEAAAFRRQVEADLLRRYPTVNLTALKAYSKAADSQAVQSQITNARSLFGTNGQPGSFDELEDAIRAVPKARFPFLSEFGQKTAYQLGSTEMATLRAIKTDIASDLAKFNAGGGNHSSDHQIELYREQLNEAQTPEQVEAVLKDLRAISSKRLVGIVGTNPYLANMTADINDPVTKRPRGNSGVQIPQSHREIPPPGATMKVPGSDGKVHWSDGKHDLGAVQQ